MSLGAFLYTNGCTGQLYMDSVKTRVYRLYLRFGAHFSHNPTMFEHAYLTYVPAEHLRSLTKEELVARCLFLEGERDKLLDQHAQTMTFMVDINTQLGQNNDALRQELEVARQRPTRIVIETEDREPSNTALDS